MCSSTLRSVIRSLRKPSRGDPRRFVSKWTEKELLNGKPVDCFVIVLRTRGCYWSRASGCSMCGYINDSAENVSSSDILAQFNDAMGYFSGQRYVKIYTSGSFLDEKEIDSGTAHGMLEIALSRAERVLIESRPEFISEERLRGLPSRERIEIAMGLESANDIILQKSVNKNMTFRDFSDACNLCRELGLRTRAYILIKPPFLTESEAIADAISSARSCCDFVDTISFNPVNVQRNTLVEYLWKRGEYRPPWLWTVLEVVESTKDLGPRIVVSTVGAGSRRGAHNCGSCDSSIIDFLKGFSLDMELTVPGKRCKCREEWLDLVDVQGAMQCSADPSHFFDR